MQISECALSAVTIELIVNICDNWAKSGTKDGSSSNTDSSAEKAKDVDRTLQLYRFTSLENVGIRVGKRAAERLSYREVHFGGDTLDAVRFIGFVLWRVMFGKPADEVRQSDRVYEVKDKDFIWLRGLAGARAQPGVVSDSLVTTSCIYENRSANNNTCSQSDNDGATGARDSMISANSRNDNEFCDCASKITRLDVLVYAVGIIRGAISTFLGDIDLTVEGQSSFSGVTKFIINFTE